MIVRDEIKDSPLFAIVIITVDTPVYFIYFIILNTKDIHPWIEKSPCLHAQRQRLESEITEK